MNTFSRVFATAYLLSPAACMAHGAYTCPAAVHLTGGTVAASDVAAGFQPLVADSLLRLSGIGMYDGPPQQGAALEPATASRNDKTIVWRFVGTYEQGKWLACNYGDGVAQLVRRIDDAARSCTATLTTKKPQGTLSAHVSCR